MVVPRLGSGRGRRLMVECLEQRRMLDAAWLGSVVGDSDGDLFAVDISGHIDFLGRMDHVMYDLAFSPAGQLYGVGGPSEGPSQLFKIDLDLLNPGGAITTTLIGVVQESNHAAVFANGLEFRDDGQLFAVGFDVGGVGQVFSVNIETAVAKTEIGLGGFLSAGDLTFDSAGNMFVTTFDGDLLKVNRALNHLDVVGFAQFGDFYGLTYGPAPQMYGFRFFTNEVYRINPVDATVTLLAALDNPLLNGILGAATVFKPPTDLGQVDFLSLTGQRPILGELWYRLVVDRNGTLTADTPGAAAGSGIQLTLFTQDASGNLSEVTTGALRVDRTSATAGQEYFLRVENAGPSVNVRLTNLVVPTANGATVYGTGGNDRFEFVHGSPTTVLTINGVDYDFDFNPATTFNVSFLAGAGADEALLTGSSGADVATLTPGHGNITGTKYAVAVSDTTTIAFEGGGGDDRATLTGTAQADSAALSAIQAQLTGASYSLTVGHVPTVEIDALTGTDTLAFTGSAIDESILLGAIHAEFSSNAVGHAFLIDAANFEQDAASGGGGIDTATVTGSNKDDVGTFGPRSAELKSSNYKLAVSDVGAIQVDALGGVNTATFNGSAGNETAVLRPQYGEFGGGTFLTKASNFGAFTANGGGGDDLASLYDSTGNDNFVGASGFASLIGTGYSSTVRNFKTIGGYASDGTDVAKFYDSPGNETFTATPTVAQMLFSSSTVAANGFDAVHAFATAGGTDHAQLFDSAGNDHFYGSPAEASLYGDGYYNRAKSFESVEAFSDAGGIDEAKLYDSPGDDTFYGTPEEGTLSGTGFSNRAVHFDGVHVAAKAGGLDRAELYDSSGNDHFVANAVYGAVDGPGFYNRTMYFDEVRAFATAGGIDEAKLFDSPGDDTFTATPGSAILQGTGFYHQADGFDGVHAYASSGGEDTAWLYDSPGNDIFYADPTQAALFGAGFYNRAKSFEKVYAESTSGGTDEARLFDSPASDLLEAQGNWARLSNAALDFLFEAKGFDHVTATASSPGNTKSVVLPLDFILDLVGPWP